MGPIPPDTAALDPATLARIWQTIYGTSIFGVALIAWLYFTPARRAAWKTKWREGRVIMSRAADGEARTGSPTGSNQLLAPDADAIEPEEPAVHEPDRGLVISHNMDDQTLILLLAAQKNEDGKNRWSANEIVKLIGGTRQEVLDTIAIVRPREPASPPAAKPQIVITPIAGRSTNAAFAGEDREAL